MPSSGYKNEQCDLIATRLERLLDILRPAGQLEGVQAVLRWEFNGEFPKMGRLSMCGSTGS